MDIAISNTNQAERDLISKCQARWGDSVLVQLVDAWLKDREKVIEQMEASEFHAAYKAMKAEDKVIVDDKVRTAKPLSSLQGKTVVS